MDPARLLARWHRLSRLPGGRWFFSRLVGLAVPYTGSIGARVEALAPGQATVTLRDRRRVRNHLQSVHAVALANLGEFASGLAMLSALGAGTRGIVTAITTRYHAKARGTLRATGTAAPPPEVTSPCNVEARAEIHDGAGVLVAEVTVMWRLAPRR